MGTPDFAVFITWSAFVLPIFNNLLRLCSSFRILSFFKVYEILDNAVDEAQAGYASKVEVILLADNSVIVTDNGRGV